MTLIYIIKKATDHWIKNLSRSDIAKSMVVQESLSISSVKAAFHSDKDESQNS